MVAEPADGFFLSTYYTQLEESEVLREIQVPAAHKIYSCEKHH